MSGTHPHDHDHDHDHGHDHGQDQAHPGQAKDEKVHGYYQLLGLALKELLIEKGVITAAEVRAAIEARDAITPSLGGKVVVRAWTDAAYKTRLLADAHSAILELGIDMGPTELIVAENTPAVHNVIVCTLCSCYPRNLLGLPPSWYKDRDYRSRVVREPRAVLKEFGTELPSDIDVRVHDSTADLRYLVLPMRPSGTEGMSEAQLADIVTRDCMIGVTLPKAP